MSDDATSSPLPAPADPGLRLNPVSSTERITLIDALRSFAPVGRMALTNYLCQSIISVFVFYGWGLGLSARFRFGPFEWLWRSLTYMKPQPMRVA